MSDEGIHDPLDIFSSSLETLHDYQSVTVASAGSAFTYAHHKSDGQSVDIKLLTPDTQAANWFLHASDIWASAHYLADNIHLLGLDKLSTTKGNTRLLELGASAGLPGILIAKLYPNISVTVSDYPDELLIDTLSRNVQANDIKSSCRVVPYAWGSDPSPLVGINHDEKFDVIIAADTLWSSSAHSLFIQTLQLTLRKSPEARIHLIAGLHTGRYTIQSFLEAIVCAGFEIETSTERQVKGSQSRPWNVNSACEEEENLERRRWVICIVLKWRLGDYIG